MHSVLGTAVSTIIEINNYSYLRHLHVLSTDNHYSKQYLSRNRYDSCFKTTENDKKQSWNFKSDVS